MGQNLDSVLSAFLGAYEVEEGIVVLREHGVDRVNWSYLQSSECAKEVAEVLKKHEAKGQERRKVTMATRKKRRAAVAIL